MLSLSKKKQRNNRLLCVRLGFSRLCAAADDVLVVFERKADERQQRLAARLQLPPNFYSYETAPPCPGCRGCDDEESDDAATASSATAPSTTAAAGTPVSATHTGTRFCAVFGFLTRFIKF